MTSESPQRSCEFFEIVNLHMACMQVSDAKIIPAIVIICISTTFSLDTERFQSAQHTL